jgi:hypothetical protein
MILRGLASIGAAILRLECVERPQGDFRQDPLVPFPLAAVADGSKLRCFNYFIRATERP